MTRKDQIKEMQGSKFYTHIEIVNANRISAISIESNENKTYGQTHFSEVQGIIWEDLMDGNLMS